MDRMFGAAKADASDTHRCCGAAEWMLRGNRGDEDESEAPGAHTAHYACR